VSIVTKMCPRGAELFIWKDRWADMTKLIVAFQNFAYTPKF